MPIFDFRLMIEDLFAEFLEPNQQFQSSICNKQSANSPYVPHPRRVTGSRQMLRPIAGAMIRSSAINRSNCDGNID